jgi:hypothetical protein
MNSWTRAGTTTPSEIQSRFSKQFSKKKFFKFWNFKNVVNSTVENMYIFENLKKLVSIQHLKSDLYPFTGNSERNDISSSDFPFEGSSINCRYHSFKFLHRNLWKSSFEKFLYSFFSSNLNVQKNNKKMEN